MIYIGIIIDWPFVIGQLKARQIYPTGGALMSLSPA
jgi:hypothetical protein